MHSGSLLLFTIIISLGLSASGTAKAQIISTSTAIKNFYRTYSGGLGPRIYVADSIYDAMDTTDFRNSANFSLIKQILLHGRREALTGDSLVRCLPKKIQKIKLSDFDTLAFSHPFVVTTDEKKVLMSIDSLEKKSRQAWIKMI